MGPISDPPLHIALSVGHSLQSLSSLNETNEYSVPELQVLHSPVPKNASPTSQDLRLIAKFSIDSVSFLESKYSIFEGFVLSIPVEIKYRSIAIVKILEIYHNYSLD